MLIYGEQGYDAAYERDQARRAREAAQWAEQMSMAERMAENPRETLAVRLAARSLVTEMAKGRPTV